MKRVKFYSKSDLMCEDYLGKFYNVVKKFNEDKKDYDINDILEFYNITLYIDNECYLKKWTNSEITEIKNVCNKMRRTIEICINSINDANFEKIFSDLKSDYEYYDDFFELIEKYNA